MCMSSFYVCILPETNHKTTILFSCEILTQGLLSDGQTHFQHTRLNVLKSNFMHILK